MKLHVIVSNRPTCGYSLSTHKIKFLFGESLHIIETSSRVSLFLRHTVCVTAD